ncbi:L-gulonolactone oxidase [Entomortierella parvispora]|uniref:D-arabinono-1,4-lactone oxidase n=1 Tax=Entomortierella parvispora TaxID=205924 RepID=A0A9P3HCR6_9FUNG|nr:L-gulonolactone oxidase [Entomortierella parvispora]
MASSTVTLASSSEAHVDVASLKSNLQQELGALVSPNRSFENWARTFRCVPEQYYSPSTEEEIIKILHLARLSGKRVKAIGTGHSPSDLACTDGFMINTDKLNRFIRADEKELTITVEAGMKLHQLHEYLEFHEMAMSNLGSISDQSVAGLMSTATHGTGAEYPSCCAAVLDLTLITAQGEKIYCSKTEKPDIFNAAVCSLGSLGIITSMTLQCEPAFRLENKQEPAKLDQVLDNLDAIIHSAEHVRLWWYPHTDNVVVWRANRTTKPVSKPPASSWRTSSWFTFNVYQGLLYICRFVPSLIPSLSRFMFWATQSRPLERVDKSVKVFNFDCLFPQYVNEWSIPWSRTAEALRALNQFIENGVVQVENVNPEEKAVVSTVKKEKGLKVHFPIEIRFVKKDDVWLSPAYGVDSCYIGIIMYRPYGKPVPYKRFWAGYEKIMTSFGGRPHWAKAHSVTYEDLEKSYPKMKQFSEIRQQLDPKGMFLNDYLRRHLVPSSETPSN